MRGTQVKIGTRYIGMHKSVRHVDFEAESVLSNDPWLFVELWLKRDGKSNALAYWLQARRFAEAATQMSVDAAPLVLYYAFLNATKTLLEVQSQSHGNRHGVSGDRPEDAKASLANEMVRFQSGGVLPALCSYLGDGVSSQEYSLRDLLWNLPFVHRAFRHTFTSSTELFIPLESACYVSREDTSEAWFQAEVASRYTDGRILRHIPTSFESFVDGDQTLIRRKKRFKWLKGRTSKEDKTRALRRLETYHASVRRVIVSISGDHDLWYLKKSVSNNPVSERHNLAVIFAAMHRLSELSRYDPSGLDRHLCGNANWLLTEFIEHSPDQFIDQVASEITGFQVRRPRVRG
jgi:hypothetical protein